MEFPPCHTRFWLCYPFRSKGRADLYVPIDKRSITSGSDYVRQLLDGYFLTLVPGNEFYLATPFFIGDGITVALSQINGHKIIFYVLMIGYLNHIVNVFVCNPDMPGPEDGITHILIAMTALPCRMEERSTLKEILPPLESALYFISVTRFIASCQTSSALAGVHPLPLMYGSVIPFPAWLMKGFRILVPVTVEVYAEAFVAEFLIALPYTSGKE